MDKWLQQNKNREKLMAFRIIAAVILRFVAARNLTGSRQIVLFDVCYLILSYDVLDAAVDALKRFDITKEEVLMVLATAAAFFIGQADKAVVTMAIYQGAKLFITWYKKGLEEKNKSRLGKPAETVHWLLDGQLIDVEADKVNPGMLIQVNNGEQIPADGTVKEGEGYLDASSLLISEDVAYGIGTEVLAGSINKGETLVMEAKRRGEQSAVNQLIRHYESFSSDNTRAEKMAGKFIWIFTAVVIVLAFGIAILGPLLTKISYNESISVGITLLVIVCGTNMVTSIPLTYRNGMADIARDGILLNKAETVEILNKLDYMAMDKDGILTDGQFAVESFQSSTENDKFLKTCASICRNSENLMAKAIVEKYGEGREYSIIRSFSETENEGVKARVGNKDYFIGNYQFTSENCAESFEQSERFVWYVVTRKEYVGQFVLVEKVKQKSKDFILDLKRNNVSRIAVFSQDAQVKLNEIKRYIAADEVYGDLNDETKAAEIAKVRQNNLKTAYIGNEDEDVLTLKTADVGIVTDGVDNLDKALGVADAVFLRPELSEILVLKEKCKTISRTVGLNLGIIILGKVLLMLCGATNSITMESASLANAVMNLLTVLNAGRMSRLKKD